MWYGGIGSSRAQLSSMTWTSSSEMSIDQRSSQRSSNQRLELVAGVVVEDVDVELALRREAGQRQVAAAEEADLRVVRVLAVEQVELGVQRVPKEQLDAHLAAAELLGEPAQARLVGVGRDAEGELLAELLGETRLQPQRRRVVHAVLGCAQAHRARGTRPPGASASRPAAGSRSRRRPPSCSM